MNEWLFFSERVSEINKELGVSSCSGFLEDTVLRLQSASASKKLPVDIITAQTPVAEVRKLLSRWKEEVEPELKLTVLSGRALQARSISHFFSSFACVMLDDELLNGIELSFLSKLLKERYKLIWVINFTSSDNTVSSIRQQVGVLTETLVLSSKEIEDKSLFKSIQTHYPEAKIQAIRKMACLNAIKPVIEVLNQLFKGENQAIQVKRLLGSQSQVMIRKDEQGVGQMEWMNQFRQQIMKYSTELERNLKLKYEEMGKPNTGAFSRLLQENLVPVVKDFERTEMAEKSEKEDIRIKASDEQYFLQSIKNFLSESMKVDASFAEEATRELVDRLNSTLTAKNHKPVNPLLDAQPFPVYKNSVRPYIQFNREFRGELMKRGITEYFVALRDYTGVIMVATGLLAPLTIIANISESGFLKHLSNGVKFGMAAITLFLIIYGVFDLKKRIPRKRVEEFEREKQKATEYLLTEGKRIYSDITRDWANAFSNWIKETSATINVAYERSMKETQMQKQELLQKERQSQQKQQQNVEVLQRNLSSAERVKELMANRWREWLMETEKSLRS